MISMSLLVIGALLLGQSSAAPAILPRDTPTTSTWSVSSVTRTCPLLELCSYSFVINDGEDHTCTISDAGYALDSWGPLACAEAADAGVLVSWKYSLLPADSGTMKVLYSPASQYATFEWNFVNLQKNLPDQGPNTVYQED